MRIPDHVTSTGIPASLQQASSSGALPFDPASHIVTSPPTPGSFSARSIERWKVTLRPTSSVWKMSRELDRHCGICIRLSASCSRPPVASTIPMPLKRGLGCLANLG